jgi:hypothetical protein
MRMAAWDFLVDVVGHVPVVVLARFAGLAEHAEKKDELNHALDEVNVVLVRIYRAQATEGHGQLRLTAVWDPGREECVVGGEVPDQYGNAMKKIEDRISNLFLNLDIYRLRRKAGGESNGVDKP